MLYTGEQKEDPKRMKDWVDPDVGCIPRWFNCTLTVSHPSSN